MASLRRKRSIYWLTLPLLGAGYLGLFSLMELNPLLEYQLALLPIQVGLLLYLLWWRSKSASDREL